MVSTGSYNPDWREEMKFVKPPVIKCDPRDIDIRRLQSDLARASWLRKAQIA